MSWSVLQDPGERQTKAPRLPRKAEPPARIQHKPGMRLVTETLARTLSRTWIAMRESRNKFATKFAPKLLLALGVSCLAGCAVGPNYKRPEIDSPAAFRSGSRATNAPAA